MTDEANAAALSTLTNAQIYALFRALPELPGSWARLAGTDPALLGQGNPLALAVLRAAFARNHAVLLGELARAGLPTVLALLDASEDDEGDEGVADFASAAGRLLGAAAAAAFLVAVASGRDPFAAEVAGRLAELRDLAARAAEAGQQDGPGGHVPQPSPPGGGAPLPDEGNADQILAPGSAAAELTALHALLNRTRELTGLGTALAARVQAAAADVAAGVPATRAARELTEWSGAVATHLADAAPAAAAADLRTLSSRLTEAIARAEAEEQATALEREHVTHEALRAARLLHDQGLDALIPAMLQGAGLDARADWRTAPAPGGPDPRAGSVTGPGPAAGVESGTAPEPDAGPEPELELDAGLESEPAPEPSAGPEAGLEPKPEPEPEPERPAGPQAGLEPQAVPETEHESESVLVPVPGAEPVPESLLVPEPRAEPEPEPAPDAAVVPDPVTEAAPVAVAATVPRPQTVLAAVLPARSEPVPDARPESGARLVREPPLEEIQFPWDGSPSLIAALISAGRDALAVCVAQAAPEPATRQRLLRFCCAAFSCAPAALELQMPELSPPEAEVKELTVDEGRLLLATVLRVGLSVGYSPVDLPSLIDRAEIGADRVQTVVLAAAEVIRHGYRREIGAAVMQRVDLVPPWSTFGTRARALRETQSRGKLPLQRASNVLHHLVLPDQPVGRALVLVTELSELGVGAANTEAQAEKWAHLEAIVLDLGTASGRNQLITDVDQAVSRGPQLRKQIVGVAMTRLDSALQDTGKLIAAFLAARTALRAASAEAGLHGAETLSKALSELVDAGEPVTPGDAALRRLTDWLRDGARPAVGAPVEELVKAELAPLYEIPRDASGAPTRIATPAEAAVLLRGRDLRDVVGGYLSAGNFAAARALVATADEADQAALDDEVQSGLQAARRRYQQARASVYSIAGRLRSVYDDAGARELTGRADSESAPEDDRFDLSTGKLLSTAADGEERLRGYREELRLRAQRCDCAEADRQRILSLIEREDEVLAVEFLTMAEAGQALPEADTEGGDDFADFFPAMVDVAVATTRRRQDAVTAIRGAAGATDTPANQRLAHGLNSWRELKSSRRATPGDGFRKQVADVLRMIGLVPRDQNWLMELSRTQRSGYATFRVRATPIDRSFVPSLGSQANSDYDLTLVWDEVTPTRLLDFIDERRRTRANIIVYFHTLDPGQRLQLRRATVGKGFSPIVVDDAAAGWLTTLAEPGWRFTQQVTLPFTTTNPYSPFAGGEVPEEVFVGREQEQAEIESPTGSMFVYGGRQLGKSALLRRVERVFTDDPVLWPDNRWHARSGRAAVYLDLKAASIGEAREPSALWPVLAERLVAADVLPKEASRIAQPDKVSKLISDWLAADDGNRLLLLLDEADNFLTKDSRARKSGGGTEFPNLQRLKELMETSDRRFKAVFAGLHQVQRFHDSSNTPVAHGGHDILIGQLSTMAAYRLVVDPMTTLGYEFASDEHVWRLLLFANYQASLVQIVCDALVKEMSRKELPPGGGRIVIGADDIERVIAKRDVRDLIVQRFWWTINLDPRYRVIALVVAARSLDGDPGETFTPEDLHEFCELYWEDGFSRAQLSGKEFRRYLEEMMGLGVLYRQDDEFGLRSPNILGLLGTRESIDQSLNDAPRELEVRDEYNPSTNRRLIGKSTELWAPRSPLTDRDIAGLLGIDGQHHGRIQVVTGSRALAIDRAASVIHDAAEERQIKCEIRRHDALVAQPRRRTHLVIDLSDSADAAQDLPWTYSRLREYTELRATVIVGPECVPLRLTGIDPADITPVKRWSAEGLRSWHDTPFTTPDMRTRLYRVTSGWPLLVEETMREIAAGKSPDDVLDLMLRRLADPGFARRHLTDCGIDIDLAVSWAVKFGIDGDDGLAEAFPVTDSELAAELHADVGLVVERLQVLDVVEATPHGWVLDRAVFAAAQALSA